MPDWEKLRRIIEAIELKAKQRGEGRRGRPPKEIAAVNAYQEELEEEYDEWADDFSDDISDMEPEERESYVEESAAALLLILLALGRKRIVEAMILALGGESPTSDLLRRIADTIADNDKFLTESFTRDLRDKIVRALRDPDIIAAYSLSPEAGRDAIRAILATMRARVGMYAGEFWDALNLTTGLLADQTGNKLFWSLDHTIDDSQHCDSCLTYGDREYASFQALLLTTGNIYPSHNTICGSNCRCILRMVT